MSGKKLTKSAIFSDETRPGNLFDDPEVFDLQSGMEHYTSCRGSLFPRGHRQLHHTRRQALWNIGFVLCGVLCPREEPRDFPKSRREKGVHDSHQGDAGGSVPLCMAGHRLQQRGAGNSNWLTLIFLLCIHTQ